MFIKVRVLVDEKKEEIIKKSEDTYLIKVKEKAERGKANGRIREVLSDYFQVSLNKVKLIKGGKRPNKIFEIIS